MVGEKGFSPRSYGKDTLIVGKYIFLCCVLFAPRQLVNIQRKERKPHLQRRQRGVSDILPMADTLPALRLEITPKVQTCHCVLTAKCQPSVCSDAAFAASAVWRRDIGKHFCTWCFGALAEPGCHKRRRETHLKQCCLDAPQASAQQWKFSEFNSFSFCYFSPQPLHFLKMHICSRADRHHNQDQDDDDDDGGETCFGCTDGFCCPLVLDYRHYWAFHCSLLQWLFFPPQNPYLLPPPSLRWVAVLIKAKLLERKVDQARSLNIISIHILLLLLLPY